MLSRSASSYLASGLCVLPATREKKRPSIRSWKQYQTRLPTEQEVAAWFQNRHDALCLICGRVSGNLECLDFDSQGAAFPSFQVLVPPELGMRLVCERSPSGGCHVFYRCSEPVEGNRKLAMTETGQVLVETRGEGGLVLVAPSDGYSLFQGAFENLPVLTPAERSSLLSAARSLDRTPRPAPRPAPSSVASPDGPGSGPANPGMSAGRSEQAPSTSEEYDLLPGADYDARADIRPLLESFGWRQVHGGDNEGWQRPGKTGDQQSATFNGTVFYVFSSNAAPFEAGRGYGKFAVYATLVHGGDLRAATEALYAEGYGHKSDPTAGVDSSAVLAQARSALGPELGAPASMPESQPASMPEEPSPEPALAPEPPSVPWSLYAAPGFLDELASYTCRTALYTNRALAFAGALALLSFLCGRRYRTRSRLSSSLYVIALADSATGKDAPRQVNFDLLSRCGYGGSFGDRFASGEGLEDSLYRSPSMFYQPDEISFLFASFSGREVSPTAASIATTILRLYTNGIYAMRVLSRKRPAKGAAGEEAKARIIRNPNLVLFGTATPAKFYQSLSVDGLENGLVGRCFVVPAQSPRARNPSPSYDEQPPAVVLDAFDALGRLGERIGKRGDPATVPEDPAATSALLAADDRCTERVNRALSAASVDEGDAALWGRAFEKCYKLALLRAVSRDPEEPCIRADDAEWGSALAEAVTRDILVKARLNLSGDEFQSATNLVRRFLLSCPEHSASRSSLLRATRIRTRLLDEVVEYLLQSGSLQQGVVKTRGRSGAAYRLLESP